MDIISLDKELLYDTYKINKNILIIADFRCVDYSNEDNTLEAKLSDELSISLYPICSNLKNLLDLNFFIDSFSEYDYWFISSTLFQYFS